MLDNIMSQSTFFLFNVCNILIYMLPLLGQISLPSMNFIWNHLSWQLLDLIMGS